MRLINADELKTAFPCGEYIRTESVRATIDHMPTIEPEQKKGKWSIKNGEIAFWDVCSECGRMVFHKTPFYNYCPHCGAKMEVEG